MKQFWRVILQILRAYMGAMLAYRLDFLQSVMTSIFWSGLSFTSAFLLTSRAPSVFGLDRSEMLLLASSYGVIIGTHHWICSRGFAGFSEVIHKGELDGYLLRPFDTITFLSIRNVNWGSIPRIIGSALLVITLIRAYGLTVTPLSVLTYFLLGICSFFIVYSFYTIACTVLIWHPYLSNIVDLMTTAVGTARYPLAISKYLPLLFTAFFIPFLTVVNIPTQALIGRLDFSTGVEFVLFAAALFAFSRWFWHYALRSYTGASG